MIRRIRGPPVKYLIIIQEMATPEENKHIQNEDKSNLDVFWDEPADQDPNNPMNWTVTRKWTIVATVSFITFLT